MFWKNYHSRKENEKQLKFFFNIASFRKHQWQVIKKLLKKKKVLMIERTGFGKSLCYQFPATQLNGVTIVFSPLISLMRDQVRQLKELNIQAELICGGQTEQEKDQILFKALAGKVKLLYIAPERQETEQWLEAMKEMQIAMMVIDEAHCISEWGHDFRPAYQKIVYTIKKVANKIPILATTATATAIVIKDIQAQVGRALLIKGSLSRPNFHLSVVRVADEHSKYAYLKETLPNLSGHGIIYCGTRINSECYARFLCKIGISAISYHAGYDNQKRRTIEQAFMDNSYKVICSTKALGMGINKPDIRFVIHTEFPGSPVDYYQEIGRAGRDGQDAYAILLFNPKDGNIYKRHIEKDFPNKEAYVAVLDILKTGATEWNRLLEQTGLSNRIIKIILFWLEKKAQVTSSVENGKRVYQLIKYPKRIKITQHLKRKELKLLELENMLDYGRSNQCRMKFLTDYFKDKTAIACGKCDACRREKIYYMPADKDMLLVKNFWDTNHPELHAAGKNKKAN